MGLTLTPGDGCISKVMLRAATASACFVSLPRGINADGKKNLIDTTDTSHALHHPRLPSLCFFSPCDHICICLRAETIQIYGLKTDKNEL